MKTTHPFSIFFVRAWVCVAASGALLALAPRVQAQAEAYHSLMQNYEGTETCLVCHGEGGLFDQHVEMDVMATIHWTWLKTNTPPGHTQMLGKQNVINNYCVAVTSNEPRCTSCHAGFGWRDDTFDFNNPTNIDCLVCHDTTGTYKKTPTGAGMPDPGVDLVYVATHVGRTSRATCGACHFYGGGGDAVKHGDLDSTLTNPTRSVDVHMGVDGANMTCTECHMSTEMGSTGHDLVGSRYSKPLPDNWLCEDCHSPTPHWNVSDGIYYNAHTGRVSCQACHIPVFARGGQATKMTWDWSTAGEKNPDGSDLVIKDDYGNPIYHTKKGSFTWASNVAPDYVWFDGNVIYTTLDDIVDSNEVVTINKLQGSKSQGRARIIPVKRFTGRQPYDAGNGTMAVPHLFPSGPTDTDALWKGYNWTNAIAAGMAAVERPFSGQVGWVNTEMFWVQNHMVAPKEEALTCTDCHSADGRIPFEDLGYEPERAARLHDLNMIVGLDHAGRFGTNFIGAAACIQCHSGVGEEVMQSVHYLWRTPNSKLAYPGGGSHGMVDRFCALVGANAMVNYFADLGEHKGSSACGKCHVGEGLPFPDPATGQFTQAQEDGLDCLICHASEGNYDMTGDGVYDHEDAEASHRLLTTNSMTGRRAWFQDRSLRAAESVGLPIGASECLRCHEHGQAAPDYKRGTPFTPEDDVHAAAGMICTDCHQVNHHKIARGSRVTDMHAWELQHVEVDCSNCHDGSAPHLDPAHAAYNEHASLIACETCHIPWTSGASRRVWASTFGVTDGPEANIPILDPDTGMYEPYSVYSDDYASRPAYRWFNGNVSMLAEPIDDVDAWDFRVATKETPGAKIYPFRPIISGMVMDRRGFGYDPNFNTNFTMAAALDAMAGPLTQMGFMRPEGLTANERAVLSQFPNLLNFDKEHYVHTGDIPEAVNIAQGRLAVMMSGQDAWSVPVEQLSAIGSNLWSGDVLGLDLPNNPMDPTYDPTAPPTEVTGSFISLNHSIKRDGALKCEDCHAPSGVMDFNALSYSAEQADHLQMLMQKVEVLKPEPGVEGLLLRWACVPGRSYQLESTPDILNVPWTAEGPVMSSAGPWMESVIPQGELGATPQKFYRFVEVSP
jgi:octaheme c-type cytochrome (tetrathionate reductase family)